MSLERLRSRFDRVQSLQGEFLSRIKQYRLTKDPNLLPAVNDADRLDNELADIARELSSSDSENDSSRDISLHLPENVPPPRESSQPTIAVEVDLDELPPARSSPVIAPTEPLLEEPMTSSKRKPRRLESFVVMSDAANAVALRDSPLQTAIPSFGEVIKNAVDDGELSLPDNESSAPETFDEPPPTYRRDEVETPKLTVVPSEPIVVLEEPKDLTYISPTPPTSPPPVLVPTVLSPPPAPVSEREKSISPSRTTQSPLGPSNERRRILADLSTDPKKYWIHIRNERERLDRIFQTLTEIESFQETMKKEFDTVRVRAIGITGEYLFTRRLSRQEAPVVDEKPIETPQRIEEEKIVEPKKEASEPSPPEVDVPDMWNRWMSQFTAPPAEPPKAPTQVIWAAATIQKWFRRWQARRRERLASMASMAEVEAVAAREALRKRRRERRGATNRDAYEVTTSPKMIEDDSLDNALIEMVD